ncbi:MAG TPA: hypothetical protein VHL31_25710 [Geminicoccus sp.]|uniref:hypothetical protein n=1 Tax=Geminicoccus sp. TaxID=2024832 RepID=UPI002E346CCA|nr:hypothetical protein [Geminicoccus sp.]HEX2529674.1 hypothetical protein [Geminicoccus sp.]
MADPRDSARPAAGCNVISLCILQVISTGFNMLSVDPQLTLAIWEGILFTVLALQAAWPKLALVLRGME